MVNNIRGHPVISYRPIRPSDLHVLEKIHGDLFPIRYESEFFQNVVNGWNIMAWGAVDESRPIPQRDELIGFITARIESARESEIEDSLSFDLSRANQTLLYILTLGVVESYRNLGIASSLINEVIKYASTSQSCRAVYLHVISYNNPAMHLYQKMSFQCIRKLSNFYFINGQHYDSFLFVYYVNGCRPPCSPLVVLTCRELAAMCVTYAKNGLKSMVPKLWRTEERQISKWNKCKESGHLLPTRSKRIIDV